MEVSDTEAPKGQESGTYTEPRLSLASISAIASSENGGADPVAETAGRSGVSSWELEDFVPQHASGRMFRMFFAWSWTLRSRSLHERIRG